MTDTHKPTILVTIKDQYGAQAIHPVCPAARTFADIAGTKTLTPPTIQHIKALGYQVDVVQRKIEI